MTGTVANGGTLYKPTLLKDEPPTISGRLNISPLHLQFIKKSLLGVVSEPGGTGWAAQSSLTTIGGKTGTAQVIALKTGAISLSERFRDHAWFVAFAPVENPQIAMAVLVEHGGHGGGAAAPIAKRAIEAYIDSARTFENVAATPPQ